MDREAVPACFPTIGAGETLVLARSVRDRQDNRPYSVAALISAAAFETLATSFWLYTIPFSITINATAAPHPSPALIVFPLMLIYVAISYQMGATSAQRRQLRESQPCGLETI